MGSLFYVVGSAGLAGPSVLYTGTVTFTVTNNDDRSHRLVFVRLGETRSVPSIVGQVRRLGSAWPPRSADVLDEAVLPDARLTKTMKVPALRPGSYALVDMGTDPASGNPYAYSDLFVVAIEVVDLPG